MKERYKKWIYTVCSYSFALALSVAISSVFFTKNSFALRHDINTLPLLSDGTTPLSNSQSGLNTNGNPTFQIKWNSQNRPASISFLDRHAYYFTSRVRDGKCTFVLNQDHYYSANDLNFFGNDGHVGFSFGVPSYRYNNLSNPLPDVDVCMQGVPFGSLYPFETTYITHPLFDDSSLVNIPPLDRVNFINLSPYYFSYSGMYRYHSIEDKGLNYTHVLKLSDIIDRTASKAYEFVMPLGRSQPDITGDITEGRNLTYSGQFTFDSSFRWRENIGNNLVFNLNWVGKDSTDTVSYSNHSGSVPCDIVTTLLDGKIYVRFTCSLDSPIDVEDGQFWAWLYIYDTEQQYIWSYDGDMLFSVLMLTTDYDSTEGDPLGAEVVGNYVKDAPGSAYKDIPQEDSLYGLTNLFNFSFVNPFAPLFGMFTDNSQCAQIPTIAGMLGSDQTTYCPWFDNNTRSILTPVISLAGIMIVFGFLVRWLGSSSGNLFEDTTKEEVSNQGGRWGHFKKGGVA